MARDRDFAILTVCAANVCRSPTTVLILRDALPDELLAVLRFDSAGVTAKDGLPWCTEARSWALRSRLPMTAEDDAHRSRMVSVSQVRGAGLVLCADPLVRSEVLRLVPNARAKVFTVAEAADLGRWVSSRADGARPGRGDGPVDRLTWLVEEMNAARGLGRPDPRDRHREVVDAHAKRRGSHRRTLGTLRQAVEAVAGSIVDVSSG